MNFIKKHCRTLSFISFIILVPAFCFFIVSLYSSTILNKFICILLLFISVISFSILLLSLLCWSGRKTLKKLKKWQIIFLTLFLVIYAVGAQAVLILLYGSNNSFKSWLITTAMTTKDHQYLATLFYDEDMINYILANNVVIEPEGDTDTSEINTSGIDFDNVTYANEYEKEILTKDEGNDLYKIIEIEGDGYKGKLIAVYDPSKVKIGLSEYIGEDGEYLTQIVSKNNAVIGMNASGFVDPNYMSSGGYPCGIVISDGKIIADNEKPNVGGGLVGFNQDNVLVLSKNMTASQAIAAGIRDAVEFGPFLIVNGEAAFVKGNGGWGDAPRSAIGQRKDGIVLFLVIDGRDYTNGIIGADMDDLTEIMQRYGAYNAVNMDGGTSSGLVVNGKLINNPISGSGQNRTRAIPDAWIVTK